MKKLTEEKSNYRYKLFWTWDHSTNWGLNDIGTQNCGVANYYTKKPESFVRDYQYAVDWCAANGIDGIGIVGMLRDSHGGIKSARKICAYAREHGVRIYLIAGLYSYGGLYYEGDSPLSLDRFLAANPDCVGKSLDAAPLYNQFAYPHGYKRQFAGCPSNQKLRDFVLDSLDYLFMAIPELGGIQMETGDSGVCLCEKCRARRLEMHGDTGRVPFISFSDMADIYPAAADVIWGRSPNAWVICETYTHFLKNSVFSNPDSPAMQAMLKMPEKTFWQWSDRNFSFDAWGDQAELPVPLRKFRHIMRAHHGTQWDGGRHTLVVDKIRRQCRLSFGAGMRGVSLFGECTPFHTNVEFNYLAMRYFAETPEAELSDYAQAIMAPRLGGIHLAENYIELAELDKKPEKIPEAVQQINGFMQKLHEYEQIRRWNWLATYLSSYHYDSRQSDGENNIESKPVHMI